MAGEEKNNRVIMINSFKGGAGKTTAALCKCVTEYKEKSRHNIFYVDMDILGTGIKYIFGLEEQAAYYNDVDSGDGHNLANKVQKIMWDDEKGNCFYVAALNPICRIRQSYGGQDKLRSNPDVERGIFQIKVKELLRQIIGGGGNNLIVIDCAPGISYIEENILEDLYDLERNKGKSVSVEEIFVTTPDAAHIIKTVENLNECSDYLRQFNRKVTILINDLYGCEGIDRRSRDDNIEDFHFNKEEIIEEIRGKLKLPDIKILYQKYSEDILKRGIINNEILLINKPDDFNIWPREDEN